MNVIRKWLIEARPNIVGNLVFLGIVAAGGWVINLFSKGFLFIKFEIPLWILLVIATVFIFLIIKLFKGKHKKKDSVKLAPDFEKFLKEPVPTVAKVVEKQKTKIIWDNDYFNILHVIASADSEKILEDDFLEKASFKKIHIIELRQKIANLVNEQYIDKYYEHVFSQYEYQMKSKGRERCIELKREKAQKLEALRQKRFKVDNSK